MTEWEWARCETPARMLAAHMLGVVFLRRWIEACRIIADPARQEWPDLDAQVWVSAPCEFWSGEDVANNDSNYLLVCPLPLRAALLREVMGNPFRPAPSPEDVTGWRLANGAAVAHLAEVIYQEQRWEDFPVLLDALHDAVCEHEDIVTHLRGQEVCPECSGKGRANCERGDEWLCPVCAATGFIPLRAPHVRGCWVLDLLRVKE